MLYVQKYLLSLKPFFFYLLRTYTVECATSTSEFLGKVDSTLSENNTQRKPSTPICTETTGLHNGTVPNVHTVMTPATDTSFSTPSGKYVYIHVCNILLLLLFLQH